MFIFVGYSTTLREKDTNHTVAGSIICASLNTNLLIIISFSVQTHILGQGQLSLSNAVYMVLNQRQETFFNFPFIV